jgi:hypothetical protein
MFSQFYSISTNNIKNNTKLPTNGSRIKHDPSVSQLYQAVTFTNTRWTQPMQRYLLSKTHRNSNLKLNDVL